MERIPWILARGLVLMWLRRELDEPSGGLQWIRCLHILKDNEVVLIVLNHVRVITLDKDDILLLWFFAVSWFERTRVIWLERTLKSAQIFPWILTGSRGKNHCTSDHGHPQSLPPVAISIGFRCSQNHRSKVLWRICEDESFVVDLNPGIVAKRYGCWTSSGREKREPVRYETRSSEDGQERLRWFEQGAPVQLSGLAP